MSGTAVRSLVIAPQWIGDAVMSQPLMAALAQRGEQLSVAALPWVAPVYRAMPEVSAVLELPFAHGRLDLKLRWQLGRRWRGQFDCAYVLPNSLKSALLPWFAGVPRRVGYQGEGRLILLNERRPDPAVKRPPMVAFYRALAGGAAEAEVLAGHAHPASHAEVHTQVQPQLGLSPQRLNAVLSAQGLQAQGYWVFAPGAEYGPAKCWPASHYAVLAKTLLAQGPWPVLLLGSGKEAALTQDIAQQAGPGCRSLAGQTSLDEAMVIIAGARGMVGNDSGLMHVGAAFGLPQVAVFGSTSPEHTPPLNTHAQVIWLKNERVGEQALDCCPCFKRSCPLGHTRCLTEVSPERVLVALQTQMQAAAAG